MKAYVSESDEGWQTPARNWVISRKRASESHDRRRCDVSSAGGLSFRQTSWKGTFKAGCKHDTFSVGFGGACHWLAGPRQNKNKKQLIALNWSSAFERLNAVNAVFLFSWVVFLSSLIKFVVGRFCLGLWLTMESHRKCAARTYGRCSCTFCGRQKKHCPHNSPFFYTKQLKVVVSLGSAQVRFEICQICHIQNFLCACTCVPVFARACKHAPRFCRHNSSWVQVAAQGSHTDSAWRHLPAFCWLLTTTTTLHFHSASIFFMDPSLLSLHLPLYHSSSPRSFAFPQSFRVFSLLVSLSLNPLLNVSLPPPFNPLPPPLTSLPLTFTLPLSSLHACRRSFHFLTQHLALCMSISGL